MKETVIYCDVCGEKGALTCYFTVDRRMDPAGSMDDVDESLDLCPKHQWTAYKLAEKLGGHKVAQSVHQDLLNRASAYRRRKQELGREVKS